ncbi:hypothetical protein PG993_005799 [Apiospora rasikravindrae]|uniref:Zn(2)-C6 fungal-type domain-containing protein n=1 Tax=Apiospora rasikravindrae TaxID=990691 RepID=A0ABR1TC61_9PEZI
MPGVPSGRACDACRQQKKKCDTSTPSCSRCRRLSLECVGSGPRRYLFIDQKCPRRRRRPGPQPQRQQEAAAAVGWGQAIIVAPPLPRTEAQTLTGAFVSTIAPSTGIGFNLLRTYGPFLDLVSPRLGPGNAALDVQTHRRRAHAHQLHGGRARLEQVYREFGRHFSKTGADEKNLFALLEDLASELFLVSES